DRSATASNSTGFTMRRRCWWGKSLRRQARRSGTRATPVPLRCAFGCPLGELAGGPLPLGQRLFLLAEDARVADLLARAAGGQGVPPNVTANVLPGGGQRGGLGTRTREADSPLARLLRLIVAVLGVPARGRCKRLVTRSTPCTRSRVVSTANL